LKSKGKPVARAGFGTKYPVERDGGKEKRHRRQSSTHGRFHSGNKEKKLKRNGKKEQAVGRGDSVPDPGG